VQCLDVPEVVAVPDALRRGRDHRTAVSRASSRAARRRAFRLPPDALLLLDEASMMSIGASVRHELDLGPRPNGCC
jgi:hypothetical protein